MDAIKILGSLLANNALGSRAGGNIIGSLLGGGNQGLAGNILGALLGGGRRSGSSAGLGALGGLLGAASGRGGGAMDVLGSLLGGQQVGGGSGNLVGGLAGLLGSASGAPQGGGGIAGKLLGGILGRGSQQQSAAAGLSGLLGGGGGSPSDMLSSLLGAAPGPVNEPPQEAHDEAVLLIEAMCNAAKVDGQVDANEQQNILSKLGDLEEDEVAFVRNQLSTSLDLQGFLSRVPSDMNEQIYAFSLMAVKLDSQAEAQYFAKLASGLGLDADTANNIHAQLGQPEIFQ